MAVKKYILEKLNEEFAALFLDTRTSDGDTVAGKLLLHSSPLAATVCGLLEPHVTQHKISEFAQTVFVRTAGSSNHAELEAMRETFNNVLPRFYQRADEDRKRSRGNDKIHNELLNLIYDVCALQDPERSLHLREAVSLIDAHSGRTPAREVLSQWALERQGTDFISPLLSGPIRPFSARAKESEPNP